MTFALLSIFRVIQKVYSSNECQSGKEFRCYDRNCCDGTEYCSEADQFCRQCIPENCYGFDVESMCKDYCNAILPPTTMSTGFVTIDYDVTIGHRHQKDSKQWLPTTPEQKVFLIIVVLCTFIFAIFCAFILPKFWKSYKRYCCDNGKQKENSVDEERPEGDVQNTELKDVMKENVRLSDSSDQQRVHKIKEYDAISNDSGVDTPPVGRRGSQSAQLTNESEHRIEQTVCSPQNDRTTPPEKGTIVTSGN